MSHFPGIDLVQKRGKIAEVGNGSGATILPPTFYCAEAIDQFRPDAIDVSLETRQVHWARSSKLLAVTIPNCLYPIADTSPGVATRPMSFRR
jgi:hypothetical protein